MESLIKKISNILSLLIVFILSAIFYFGFKGFTIIDGKVVLIQQDAQATEKNGIATILPGDILVNVSQKYAVGSENAPLTMYEYSSLGCPHCGDFHLDILPLLKQEYIDKGLLRVVFVNFPLDKKSMNAAMISQCMTYENYFGFINQLFSKQRFWWMDSDNEQLIRYAAEYGLTYDESQACMNNDAIAQEIVSSRQDAITRLKIQGTPAFLFTGKDGNEIIYGVPNYRDLKNYIDSRLMRL